MGAYRFSSGDGPLLVTVPHAGTRLSAEIGAKLTATGRRIADTDWDVDILYDFLNEFNASCLVANHSRYVIDLNRADDGAALYPGHSETGLCPVTSFAGQPLYRAGQQPDSAEIQHRKELYWQPYHDKIRIELERIKHKFGYALLWDAHSIKSRVPRFFDGPLPDLNLGTANGVSCERTLAEGLFAIAKKSGYSAVLNGRFKGGYITRHYGDPAQNIHAIQLEISQTAYMTQGMLCPDRADKLRPVLRAMLKYLTGYIENTVEENK